jgi:uncharacterized membrane protein YdjX (TVP38/TMEM64 family)
MYGWEKTIHKFMKGRDKPPIWWQVSLALVIFGVYAAVIVYYFSRYDTLNHKNVQAFIDGFGVWAPLAYAVLYAIGSPIPYVSMTLSAASGFLFGKVWGTIYAVLVSTISSLIPFSLARRLGHDWVMDKVHEDHQLDSIYRRASRADDFVVILAMRLIPIMPWEVQNYVAGLTPVSIFKFLIATAIGCAPGMFLHAFLGASIINPTSPQFLIALVLNGMALLVPASFFVMRRYKKKHKRTVEVTAACLRAPGYPEKR